MVNNLNPRILARSAYKLRVSADGRTRLGRRLGPIYDLAVVKQLLSQHGIDGIDIVNAKASLSMVQNFVPALTKSKLLNIILSLSVDRHYVESEICKTSIQETVDADAYKIRWNTNKDRACDLTGCPVYVKLGFRDDDPTCLIVSIKPSNY